MLVLVLIRPEVGGVFAVALFFVTLFCAASGTFSILGLGLRRLWRPEEFVVHHVAAAFRQSLFFALLLVIVLVLQHAGALTWITLSLSVVVVTVFELLVLRFRPRKFRSRR